jgi:hypothetical protein
MGIDPFDEFEFKPLTEGLGFHQKDSTIKQPIAPSKQIKNNLKNLDFQEPTNSTLFKPTLPRNDFLSMQQETKKSMPETSAVDAILQTLHKSRDKEKKLHAEHHTSFKKAQQSEVWLKTHPLFSAMLLDSMLVTAASLLCMIIVLMITRVDLLRTLTDPDSQGLVYLATFSLFAGVGFIYTVVHRAFMGFTPGEWAYDLRPGSDYQIASGGKHLIFLIARQVLNTLCGLVVLPLIGWIARKDILGMLTQTTLHKKN